MSNRSSISFHVLRELLAAELASGIVGLRLFMACVVMAMFVLGSVWMLGAGLSRALSGSGAAILGGDIAITTVNAPLGEGSLRSVQDLGQVSRTVELRTSATVGEVRAPVELKAVDDAYPLYGTLRLADGVLPETLFADRNGLPGALVEPAFLARFSAGTGDIIRIGDTEFRIDGTLLTEPDRLSAGRFMVGPRILIGLPRLEDTGLLRFGSLVEYRYRIRLDDGTGVSGALAAIRDLNPQGGWEIETPQDAGDQVRRTVDRTTTFLGVAGVVALAVGLAGAWAAASVWVARRARTIALYRLSGATPVVVVVLHAVIIAVAACLAIAAGLGLAGIVAAIMMDTVATRLQLLWSPAALVMPALQVTAILAVGIAGASIATLSGAARLSPGAAMRSGDAPLSPAPHHLLIGAAVMGTAIVFAIFTLPFPALAATAGFGLGAAAGILGLCGWALARIAARGRAPGFIALVARQGLSMPGAVATKAVAIGIGIAGVTAIIAAQSSLEQSLKSELPDRIPDIILMDVQPSQVDRIAARIEGDPALSDLQSSPFMRAIILSVNDIPAADALKRPGKSWVIEGDRSFAWAAEPTGAELLAGEWWDAAYDGPPLISAEEDVQEAFDLKPGDRITYSVLGRTFTSEVANIRKEYHRTFRPEFLMVASPQPFRDAPHSWVMSLEGRDGTAVDNLIRELATTAPNITAIDIRRIVAQVTDVIAGAVLASLAVAVTLLVSGALSVTAVFAADVDARRREALAFVLIGASRREVALARLAEAAAIGAGAAVLGGMAGQVGGYWLVAEALHIAWAPGVVSFLLPLALGVIAAIAAGLTGGISALPKGPGAVARQLSA
ncbi:MAG: FtsX-like permease family protein [Alphaproteobacteria bacterium]